MRIFWCLGFSLLTSIAHAACPAPLTGAQAGWFTESYPRNVPFDDKAGLISPPPIGAMNAMLPASFEQLNPAGGDFPNFAFMARFRVCEAGSYEFYTFIQRVRPLGPAITCRMSTRVGGSRIADTNESIRNEQIVTSSGRITLEPGWAEVRLSLSCNGNFMAAYRRYMANNYFAARVRGPNDNLQRDFAPGEIANLGRATLASQAGSPPASPGSSQAPPPLIVAPAPIPEERDSYRSRQRRQNLQFN